MRSTAYLCHIKPGPECVTAADPDAVTVNWDSYPGPARDDKMRLIRREVRVAARTYGILHQLPQVVLVAPDGAAIELFGTLESPVGVALIVPDTPPG